MSREAAAAAEEAEDDDDDEDLSLLGCVRSWMADQEGDRTNSDSLHDFNLKVRFQGHVDSTPPDHMGAVLQAIAMQSCTELELESAKQPALVAKKVQPIISKWAFLLGEFYKKCDCLAAADIIVSSLSAGVAAAHPGLSDAAGDCMLVGFLMATRDELEPVEDEDLLTACRKLDSTTKVMQGFIEFLDDGSDDEDDEDD